MTDNAKRQATDEDRARVASLVDELNPDHTSLSLTLEEATILRTGFLRRFGPTSDTTDPRDEAIYQRLCEAVKLLESRAAKRKAYDDAANGPNGDPFEGLA